MMTKVHPLDSILPSSASASAEGDILCVAGPITMQGDVVLAQIERTDVLSGHSETELVRLKPGARRSASLVMQNHPDETERRVAEAMAEGVRLVRGADKVWAPVAADEALAQTVNGLELTGITGLEMSARWCAVLSASDVQGQSALHLIDLKAPDAVHRLDTGPLNLGGWRRLIRAVFAGEMLYAAVADPVAGFGLFRCNPGDEAPTFVPVLSRGAQRFALNATISASCACDAGLLLGTAALAGPSQPVGDWGAELLLITPNGEWDLLAGHPRFSPDGLMLPVSGQMPGMGRTGNSAVQAIVQSAGRTVIAIQGFSGAPCEDRRQSQADMFDYRGTLWLYLSTDLMDWEEVVHDLPADMGAVTGLCLAGGGLYVGHEGLGGGSTPVSYVPLS